MQPLWFFAQAATADGGSRNRRPPHADTAKGFAISICKDFGG